MFVYPFRITWLAQFVADTDMKQAVISCLQTLGTISSTPGYSPWCHDGTNVYPFAAPI
jgi:hypothetical protein